MCCQGLSAYKLDGSTEGVYEGIGQEEAQAASFLPYAPPWYWLLGRSGRIPFSVVARGMPGPSSETDTLTPSSQGTVSMRTLPPSGENFTALP